MVVRADEDVLCDVIGVLLIAEQAERVGVNRGTVLGVDLREKRLAAALFAGTLLAPVSLWLIPSTVSLARTGANRAQRGLDDVETLPVRRGPLHGKPF